MRYFSRGRSVNFLETFYDSSGDIASPSSVSLTISHPTTITHGDFPPVHYKTTTAVMTQSTDLSWSGVWDTSNSASGTVFYHIKGDSFATDGEFEIRANRANRLST